MKLPIRNPRWHGEVRKRETGDAHIEENIIDLAIDAAWVLFRIVFAITKMHESDNLADIEAFEPDVRRIKSTANEVRHLTALVNHKKY